MNSNSTPPSPQRQARRSSDLPVCDVRTYLRELAYVAREAATTTNPQVARLSLQLLTRQASTLAAIVAEPQ